MEPVSEWATIMINDSNYWAIWNPVSTRTISICELNSADCKRLKVIWGRKKTYLQENATKSSLPQSTRDHTIWANLPHAFNLVYRSQVDYDNTTLGSSNTILWPTVASKSTAASPGGQKRVEYMQNSFGFELKSMAHDLGKAGDTRYPRGTPHVS